MQRANTQRGRKPAEYPLQQNVSIGPGAGRSYLWMATEVELPEHVLAQLLANDLCDATALALGSTRMHGEPPASLK